MSSEGTGAVIAGRYRLERELGRGGMGVVWEAHDVSLDRRVAVKGLLLRPADGSEEQNRWVRRARHEARALAKVRHENVVAAHDVIEDGDRIWIVMELFDSRTVADLLREQRQLSVPHAARIALQVLRGLRAAHAADVLHRDVKPSNILYRPDGHALLMDFGIAVVGDATRVTRSHEVVGSLAYLAPELLRPVPGAVAPASPASDLWSLGITLYEMIEGRRPFAGTEFETLIAVREAPVPPMRFAGPLAGLTGRLLEKDPERRPDAGEAERVLRAVAEGAGDIAADIGNAARTPSGVRRWKAPLIALCTALAVAAGVLTWMQLEDTGGSGRTSQKPPKPSAEEVRKQLAGGDGVLQIGVKEDQPGLSELKGGRYEGFEPDLARQIARELGFGKEGTGFEFVPVTSQNRADKLRQDVNGHAELELATYSINDVNERSVTFAGHYFSTLGAVLVRSKAQRTFNDLGELQEADPATTHVCTASGSGTYATWLKENKLAEHMKTRRSYDLCVEALLDEDTPIYGVITDEVILQGLHARHAESTKVLSPFGPVQEYGVALAKGNSTLAPRVCEALEKVVARPADNAASWVALYKKNLEALLPHVNPPDSPCGNVD
ncbi:serine/threonine-protein kinase [Streptomyces sp. NPDC005925]|uniref:serine/threonine-protein kinase n=1 Tax=Streptomyces sp. NPDC005925 TaxID=3157172 RepID=UPI0033F8532B